ncbi:hypothetical protein [Bacillus alkalisoli]|nr:hypothetical protein [Bacillus alkalisoli]
MKKILFLAVFISAMLGFSISSVAHNTDVYAGYWKKSGTNPPSKTLPKTC